MMSLNIIKIFMIPGGDSLSKIRYLVRSPMEGVGIIADDTASWVVKQSSGFVGGV